MARPLFRAGRYRFQYKRPSARELIPITPCAEERSGHARLTSTMSYTGSDLCNEGNYIIIKINFNILQIFLIMIKVQFHDALAVLVESRSSSSRCSLNTKEPVDELSPAQATNDEEVCNEFLQSTCGCKKVGAGGHHVIHSFLWSAYYLTLCAQSALLTQNKLDVVLLGSNMSTTLDDSHSVRDGWHEDINKHKISSNFMHHEHNVCKVTFSFLHGIRINHRTLAAMRKHYHENGLNFVPTKIQSGSLQEPYPLMTLLA